MCLFGRLKTINKNWLSRSKIPQLYFYVHSLFCLFKVIGQKALLLTDIDEMNIQGVYRGNYTIFFTNSMYSLKKFWHTLCISARFSLLCKNHIFECEDMDRSCQRQQ